MKQKLEDYPMRVKLLKTALELYLEKGITYTTNQMIAKKASCSPGEITHFFGTKENILCEVIHLIIPNHQETLENGTNDISSPAIKYLLEIAVEIAMCEQSSVVRDLYVNAYTLPKTIELIRNYSYRKSIKLFSNHLIEWSEQDFYEVESLTMGIVFGSLMDRCNPRYNLKQKLKHTMDALLKIYEFSKNERNEAIKTILNMDIEEIAKNAETKMRNSIMQELSKIKKE